MLSADQTPPLTSPETLGNAMSSLPITRATGTCSRGWDEVTPTAPQGLAQQWALNKQSAQAIFNPPHSPPTLAALRKNSNNPYLKGSLSFIPQTGLVQSWPGVCARWVLCPERSPRVSPASLLPQRPAGAGGERRHDRPHPPPLQLCLLCIPRPREQVSAGRRSFSRSCSWFRPGPVCRVTSTSLPFPIPSVGHTDPGNTENRKWHLDLESGLWNESCLDSDHGPSAR